MKGIPVRHIHPAAKEPTFTENFVIRDVHELLAGRDMVQELHRHDFFFVLALRKGAGSHEIDFVPHKVSNSSVFFMRPGQVHQLKLKAQSTGYLMEFKTDFYYPQDKLSSLLLRKASHKPLCQLSAGGFNNLYAILAHIYKEYAHKQELFQEVIKANLGLFLIELIRNRQNRKDPLSNAHPYTQERLDKFLELLETHIASHKQVSHYADLLHLSPYQLNAITKEGLGKTSSELINDTIILESKRYLVATSQQVSQIAYQLGYEDVSYFIRFFRKHTGYTPEAFRHNFK